jgi:hypothetical protein
MGCAVKEVPPHPAFLTPYGVLSLYMYYASVPTKPIAVTCVRP